MVGAPCESVAERLLGELARWSGFRDNGSREEAESVLLHQ